MDKAIFLFICKNNWTKFAILKEHRMDENNTPHPDYIKGFNEGYLLAKHDPELLEKLPVDLGKSERGAGFKAGKEQYFLEKAKERQPAWMRKDRIANLDKTKGKDKGDLDKE